MRRLAVFALLAGLMAGLSAAQPPADKKGATAKDKDKKESKDAPPAPPATPLPDTSQVKSDEKSFTSADGVKLRGLFYPSTKGGSGPVVILMHEFRKDPNDSRWDGTAKVLAASGFNAFRFAFRGHGSLQSLHSKDIVPEEFFLNPLNRQFVRAPNPAAKNTLDLKDFGTNTAYLPMLVQDLAAARNLLDQMNDAGECNTSSVYLLGSGEMVNLGLLFLASEWHRERERVRTFFGTVPAVSAGRPLLGGGDPAGQDYAGAVWLGPAVDNTTFPTNTVKNWVDNVSQLKIRNETPMLFLHGSQDQKGKAATDTLFNTVLRANIKVAGGGGQLPKLPQTFRQEVKGSKNPGSGLLGNNLGTEQTVIEYLNAVEKERKNKPRKSRDFEKPLYIDVRSFGLMQG